MKIEEALDLAARFIVLKLHGNSSSIEMAGASFDADTETWTIICTFRRTSSTHYEAVTIKIDDNEEEVTSFNTKS